MYWSFVMHPWTQRLITCRRGPQAQCTGVIGHGIAGLLVGRAMVDGAIGHDVGLALSAVAS